MYVRTVWTQTAWMAAVRVAALLVAAVVFSQRSQAAEKEATLQDAINARAGVTVLAQEVAGLDAEILAPMRKVVAKAEAQQMAANIFLGKDKYAEAVKAYAEAAAFYRQALDGRKLLERLAEARAKVERARLLVETSVPPEKKEAAKRSEINADGYVEAAEFEQAIAELARARAAYEALLTPGAPATLEQVVAARTAMLSARKQVRDLPPFDSEAKALPVRRRPLPALRSETAESAPKAAAKPGSLPGLVERARSAEKAALEALEARDYTPACALFTRAEQFYREAAALQAKRDQVVELQKTAEQSRTLADKAFETPARPASFELGKQALADGANALAAEDLDKARQLYNQAVEQFARAQNEAQAANLLAKAQSDWAAALATVDENLLTRRTAGSFDTAKKLAAEAEAKTAGGDVAAATNGYRLATAALKGAVAEALTAENAAKAPPVIQRLETALSRGDKFGAEDVLAELEKLIPSDPRMAALRQKVAAVPGPSKNLSLDLGGGINLDLVLICPGSFMMGSEKISDAKPVHKVTITKPFYLGKCEVTQQQWEAVMGSNPSNFKAPRNPVEMVSWSDCQKFLKRLTKKLTAKAPVTEFRLPTEAEWEYACRAGSTTEFCFGEDEAGLADYAWISSDSGQKTHPVGEREPNAWDLCDMHGNVWEWCADWYADKYPDGAVSDPIGPPSGQLRVLRGGSRVGDPARCRSAYRGRNVPSHRTGDFGLRVVGVVRTPE